jgi:hypothetical protein
MIVLKKKIIFNKMKKEIPPLQKIKTGVISLKFST